MSAKKRQPNVRLRAAREERGLTLQQVADLIADHVGRVTGTRPPIDGDHVGRYERGLITWPGKWYRMAFRELYRASSDEEIGFHSRRSTRAVRALTLGSGEDSSPPSSAKFDSGNLQPVDRRQFLSGIAGAALFADLAPGRRIGATEVDGYRRIRDSLERQDNRFGGDVLYQSGSLQLQRLSHTINTGHFTSSTGRQLRQVAGELSILTGWFAFDANQHATAWYYYTEGLSAARLADCSEVEIWALEKMSRLATEAQRPRDAIELAQQALRTASPHKTARVQSFLRLREARGWAVLRDGGACDKALADADRLFDRGTHPADPAWLGFYDEAELDGQIASCQSLLGRFMEAKHRNSNSLALLRPEYVRNRALWTLGVAEASASVNQPDESAGAACAAPALLDQVTSTRAATRLGRLHGRLVRAHGATASVKDFSDRFRATA